MASNIVDSLFQAVDILASAKINDLQFDKTLVCTIESVENAERGEYRVTDGSTHFLAYSENTAYAEGARVYVTVPNGDMANQKIITGKYISANNDEYFNYVSPLENFVDVTGNLITDIHSASLLANDPARKEYNICEINNVSYKGYDRLGFSAEFQTWLKSLKIISGSYGVRIDIVGKTEAGTSEYYSLYLDSADMYGNPYDFVTYFKQEKQFNISMIYEITNIRIVFYQKADFISEDSQQAAYIDADAYVAELEKQFADPEVQKELRAEMDRIMAGYESVKSKVNEIQKLTELTLDGTYPDNIFVQNFYLSLGYDLESFTEDRVLLGTHDSLMYNKEKDPLDRHIYMRWVHQIGEKFTSIDKVHEIPEEAVIHWYRYRLEQGRNDELAGNFWQEFYKEVAEDPFNCTFRPDIDTQYDKFKVIIEYPCRKYISENLTANEEIAANLRRISDLKIEDYGKIEQSVLDMCELEDYDAIAKIQNEFLEKYPELQDDNYYSSIVNTILAEKARVTYYESEVLTFTNEVPQELESIDLIQGLGIECDAAGYNGVYRLYDDTNNLINSVEGTKLRILKATYTSIVTGEEQLDKAEEITWYIPVQNTMIVEPQEGKEYSEANGDIILPAGKSGLDGYMAIKRKGIEITGPVDNELQLIEVEQLFRIKSYYTQTAANNTIFCVVRKNGKDYEAEVTPVFGATGSNGTEATFLLTMYDPEGYETTAITRGKSVKIYPSLYDYNNNPVDIKNTMVRYSWHTAGAGQGVIMAGSTGISASLKGNEALTLMADNDIWKDFYYILKAEIPWGQANDIDENGTHTKHDITLSALLPIAIRDNDDLAQIEGATRVMYDMSGTDPHYYKDPFKLYKVNSFKPENVSWVAMSEDYIKDPKARRYYPSLIATGEFTPTAMYYDGLQPFCVYAFDTHDSVTNKDHVLWHQPILIAQNRYSSAMLNAWNGELTIDENNGTIMSAMVGAGIKEDDNSFSGVLMGDVGGKTGAGRKSGLGLYGYDHGEQSYGFNVDGTAFIGKSGKGRIEFDGNNGTIKSFNYETPTSGKIGAGMLIDLDDSVLNAYGTAGSFELDMNPSREGNTDQPLLQIKDAARNTLMYIAGNKKMDTSLAENEQDTYKGTRYYLQSSNYNQGTSGLKLDLENSKLYMFGAGGKIKFDASSNKNLLKIESKTGNTLINIADGDGQYYIQSDTFRDSTRINEEGITETIAGFGLKMNINEGSLELAGSENNIKTGDVLLKASGEPYFRVRTVFNNKDKNLIYVSKDKLYFRSRDYYEQEIVETDDENTKNEKIKQSLGTEINLADGTIRSYKFKIQAYGHYKRNVTDEDTGKVTQEDTQGSIIIDSTSDSTPFKIGPNFSVDWGGNLEARSIVATAGRIGGWYIDSKGIYDYNPSKQTARKSGMALLHRGDSTDTSLRIAVGEFSVTSKETTDTEDEAEKDVKFTTTTANSKGFAVHSDGTMKCYKGEIYSSSIESCTITNATISRATITGTCTVKGTLSGGYITGSTIKGSTITGTTISGSTITGSTVSATGYVTCSGLIVGGTEYGMNKVEFYEGYYRPRYDHKYVTKVTTESKSLTNTYRYYTFGSTTIDGVTVLTSATPQTYTGSTLTVNSVTEAPTESISSGMEWISNVRKHSWTCLGTDISSSGGE